MAVTKEKLVPFPPQLTMPLLRAYRSTARVSDAELLVGTLVESKIKSLPDAYATLLGLYAHQRLWDKATTLWNTLTTDASTEINALTLSEGLRLFLLKKDLTAAEALFSELDNAQWENIRSFSAASMLAYLRSVESRAGRKNSQVMTGRLPAFLDKLAAKYRSRIRRADKTHFLAGKALATCLASCARHLGPHPAWINMMSLLLSDPFPNLPHGFFNILLPLLREFGVLTPAEVALIRQTLSICDPKDAVVSRLRVERNHALKFATVWTSVIESRLRALDYVAVRELQRQRHAEAEEEAQLAAEIAELSEEAPDDQPAAVVVN